MPPPRFFVSVYPAVRDPIESIAVAVGQDEDAGASVRGANVARSQHAPFRIEPEVGQVPKNSSEPASSER